MWLLNCVYQLVRILYTFFQKKRLYYSFLILHLHPQYAVSIAVLTNNVNAKIAQLVERDLAKVEVAGSSPVFRSNIINARMVLFLIIFLKN